MPEETPVPVATATEEAKASSVVSTTTTAGVPSVKHRIITKATSVMALCLLLLVGALIALTFRDAVTWKETFAGTLGAVLGYYIGRDRTQTGGK